MATKGGMKLNFLNNPTHKLAVAKRLPVKQVEAIILYGKPEERAKAVRKVIPQVSVLSQHEATHHLVLSLLGVIDNATRAELHFAMRKDIEDLSKMRYGNVVVQQVIETAAAAQKREIAQALVEDFSDLARHQFANHVAKKLIAYPVCVEELRESFVAAIPTLAVDNIGQHVVAEYVRCAEGGWRVVADTVTKTSLLGQLVSKMSDSAVLSALFEAPLLEDETKFALAESLCEPLENLTEDERHAHSLASLIGWLHTHEKKYKDLFCSKFVPLVPQCLAMPPPSSSGCKAKKHKMVHVVEAFVSSPGTSPKDKKDVVASLVAEATKVAGGPGKHSPKPPLFCVAMHPIMSLVLRAVINSDIGVLSADKITKELLGDAGLVRALATDPVGSPVLQGLVGLGLQDPDFAHMVYRALAGRDGTIAIELYSDKAASFLIQALLVNCSDDKTRAAICRSIFDVDGTKGKKRGGSDDPQRLVDLALSPVGTHTLQRSVIYGPDAFIVKAAAMLLEYERPGEDEKEEEEGEEDEEDEEREVDESTRKEMKKRHREAPAKEHREPSNFKQVAMHRWGSYAVATLLRTARDRNLIAECTRPMMQTLKLFVSDLACSPWAGRIVLDAMFYVATKELKEAIREVIFLKTEAWLSEPPSAHSVITDSGQYRDPLQRRKRQEMGGRGDRSSSAQGKKHPVGNA